MSPQEQAAIVLLSLGQKLAAEILKAMSKDEQLAILNAMRLLGRVSPEQSEQAIAAFGQLLATTDKTISDPSAQLDRILTKLCSSHEHKQALLDQINWDYQLKACQRLAADQLFQLIAAESAQTQALVLSHCPPKKGAELLKLFSKDQRPQILLAMATMEKVAKELLIELDQSLLSASQKLGQAKQTKGGAAKAAAILAQLGEAANQVLDGIHDRDPALSKVIEEQMFTFSDLAKSDPKALAALKQHCEPGLWPLALRGETQVLAILSKGLSQRAAEQLSEDIEVIGPQKKSAVLAAQHEILAKAKELEAKGVLSLRDHEDWVA